MLDIHPPEHGIHGVGDFLLHLLTITVGLLIALGLEASVEGMHHRSERKEAEATLRQELTENRKTLVGIQKHSDEEGDSLAKILVFLEDLREGRKGDASVMKMGFNIDQLESASWHTASITGALSYMDHDEVQRFSEAYRVQEVFADAATTAFDHAELLMTYSNGGQDPLQMKPQDVESAIATTRLLMADISTMSDITRGALRADDAALQ